MSLPFTVQHLGTLEYSVALERQKREHARVAAGGVPTLLLLEHPAVLTLGRKAHSARNVLAPAWQLEREGIAVIPVERGGDVTYHGPGQLVGYPIFPVGRRVRDFLRKLENALIHTLADYGLEAYGNDGYAGVFVGADKIASIGVAIQQGVSFHGFALNVNTRLEHFGLIHPCGLLDTRMTSLERVLGEQQTMPEVAQRLEHSFALEFAAYDWDGQRRGTLEGVGV